MLKIGLAISKNNKKFLLYKKNELFKLNNTFLSTHISGNFKGYQMEVVKSFADNLNRYLNNKSLKNRVCKKRLY